MLVASEYGLFTGTGLLVTGLPWPELSRPLFRVGLSLSNRMRDDANITFTLRDPEVHYMSMGLGNYWRYQAIAGEVGNGQKVGGATSPKS